MAPRPALLALLLLALAAAPGVAGSAGERFHRLHVPPPPVEVLPQSLAVDEFEWGVRGTHLEVKAGLVRIHVYNRGMDDHDLTVVDASGVAQQVAVKPGESGTLVVALEPGSYRLYCSLFAGTPESHEALGMHKTIEVR
jgi:plastocyanin